MRRTPLLLLIPATLAGLLATFSRQPALAAVGGAPASGRVARCSRLGCAPDTKEVGGAVQSRVFPARPAVLFAGSAVRVAPAQAVVDLGSGPRALALCHDGLGPEQVVK